jgi:hypothetical protein
MTMTAREAFERGTATFNAHDIEGFAKVLADDVVFKAPINQIRVRDQSQDCKRTRARNLRQSALDCRRGD